MEAKAEGEAGSSESNTEIQRPLEHISSEELCKDQCHHPTGKISGFQNTGLQHDPERRHEEPLSSVSSLEVHFDLLDLTELTDLSDQELAEVFVESEEENNDSPLSGRYPLMHPLVCMQSPALTRCGKTHAPEQKHSSDSETFHKTERSKQTSNSPN